MGALKNTLDCGFEFYVVKNLNATEGCRMEYYDDFSNAFKTYSEYDSLSGQMPALGVQKGSGCLDLMHQIDGDNVLVTDYRKIDVLSNEMKTIKTELNEVVKHLVDSNIVSLRYCSALLPQQAYSHPVVVPITSLFVPDKYCDDKLLKAGDGVPFTAINEVLVQGHGWVDYKELLNNVSKYAEDYLIKIEQVNVDYVKSDKLFGVDGQMDLSVDDFEFMADKINKKYYVSVYDKNCSRFDRSNFAVMSFDDLSSAVKAWYDVNEKSEFTPGVVDKITGNCVFNGCDDRFNTISYEKAAEIYGFNKEKSVDALIRDAKAISESSFKENNKVRSLEEKEIE